MGNTLGIHWAATTHGTWLHGDPRGSWREGRLIGPDLYLEAESRARMTSDAVLLGATERGMVAEVFGEIVRERRHRVLAATVQAAHVHIVFARLGEDVKAVIARLKRRSAVKVLSRRRDNGGADQPVGTTRANPAGTAGLYSRAILARSAEVPHSLWTNGKFPVFIFSDRQLVNAIEYVRDHNRRIGLPADPFSWIDPLYPAPGTAGARCYQSAGSEELQL